MCYLSPQVITTHVTYHYLLRLASAGIEQVQISA